jgi:hypothetical protein
MIGKIILAVAVAATLAGCEFQPSGTTAAYIECYDILKAQSLTDDTAKIACINKHQVSIERPVLSGTGESFQGGVQLYFTNTSPDVVVTGYWATVSTTNGKSAAKSVQGVFVQPAQRSPVYFSPSELNGITVDDLSHPDKTGKPTWYVDGSLIRGLNIDTGVHLSKNP